MENLGDIVELQFNVIGNRLKIDHGYKLYAALKTKIIEKDPTLLVNRNFPANVNISQLFGKEYQDVIFITNKSTIKIRGPQDYLCAIKKLLNEQIILVGGTKIFLYEATLFSLQPTNSLISNIVVIKYPYRKDIDCQERFLMSCRKQLLALNIEQEPVLIEQKWNSTKQKIMTVEKDTCKTFYVGYGVAIHDLTEEESISLKIKGIGGKRHMGCGWFE